MGRGLYKDDAGEKLGEVERRRRRLKVTVSQLADRAGISERTLANIRRTRRAFPRQLRALQRALVLLEREQRAAAALFSGGGDAD